LLNGVVRQPLAVFPVIRLNLENNFLSCLPVSFVLHWTFVIKCGRVAKTFEPELRRDWGALPWYFFDPQLRDNTPRRD
jgi:hypothetical protein